MASPEPIDPYLVPGTNVLRNRLGITSSDELSAAEADLSFARALQLVEEPVAATNDLTELQSIHFHLFQDLYNWAGQIRTIDVRKNIPGAEFFLPHGYIGHASALCFTELAEDNFLARLPRTEFVRELAYHYEKINYIHPFREGNGRMQRIYWNRVAHAAGWQLDWRTVHGEENHAAARAGSDQQDLGPLIAMFDKIVTSPDPSPSADWAGEEIRRLSIAPNDD